MIAERFSPTILLGSGGPQPRTCSFNEEGYEIQMLFETEPHGSVYALAESPGGRFAVAGTRCGSVHNLDRAEKPAQPVVRRSPSSPPIVSACFLGRNEFVTSHAGGIMLRWLADDASGPETFQVSSTSFCGLVSTEDSLIGYAVDGRLAGWDLSGKRRFITGRTAPPSKPFATVRGIQPSNWDRLVYPGRGGCLILLDPATGNFSNVQAHDDESITLFVFDDRVFSAGRTDGWMKAWASGSDQPERMWRLDAGVLSGCQLPVAENLVLLVCVDGSASVWEIRGDRLYHIFTLPGSDYRTVLPRVPAECAEIRLDRRTREAERIKMESESALVRRRPLDDPAQLERLEAIGFAWDAWDLRARDAENRKDHLAELESREHLSRLLPDEERFVPFLVAHADLLARLGCLAEAGTILDRAIRIAPDESLRGLRFRVESLLGSEKGVLNLFDPPEAVSIPDMIHAADLLHKPFTLPTQVKEHPIVPCRGQHVPVAEFLYHYDKAAAEESWVESIRPTPTRVRPLRREGPGPVREGWRFYGGESAPGLAMLFLWKETSAQTLVLPVLVFVPNQLPDTDPPCDFNEACLRTFVEHQKSSVTRTWLDLVYRYFREALGQTVNRISNSTSRRNTAFDLAEAGVERP